jgi:E3 ubiquitin-protein ligase TRIP12
VSPKFSKKKRCVARASLLEQGEKIINELASNRAMLEIHYEDEVGTGLGPTLEFYTLMSREFQRADLSMWRGELCPPLPGDPPGAASTPLYVHSPVGLFPSPLGPSASYSKVEEICSKFKFLGKFIAKAVMDSRMLDVPLSDAFYKWMLGQQGMFTAQDLQHVDPVVARSFAQLAAVAVNKHKLESDPLLSDKALSMGIEALSLDGGGSIDDLDLDFTLPGYPDIELKPGGKDVAVNIHNLDEYLKLVVDWTLVRGVARQVEAFKEGVASVLPLSSLHTFYPSEVGPHVHTPLYCIRW